MTLVLQTNVSGRLAVWLIDDGRIICARRKKIVWHSSDQALALVEQTIKQAKINLHRLSRIVVVRGPGPFTAVRTGLIIANTLSLLLKVPVRGAVANYELTKDEVLCQSRITAVGRKLIRPWYGKEPNISKPKLKYRQAIAKR